MGDSFMSNLVNQNYKDNNFVSKMETALQDMIVVSLFTSPHPMIEHVATQMSNGKKTQEQ